MWIQGESFVTNHLAGDLQLQPSFLCSNCAETWSATKSHKVPQGPCLTPQGSSDCGTATELQSRCQGSSTRPRIMQNQCSSGMPCYALPLHASTTSLNLSITMLLWDTMRCHDHNYGMLRTVRLMPLGMMARKANPGSSSPLQAGVQERDGSRCIGSSFLPGAWLTLLNKLYLFVQPLVFFSIYVLDACGESCMLACYNHCSKNWRTAGPSQLDRWQRSAGTKSFLMFFAQWYPFDTSWYEKWRFAYTDIYFMQ